MAGVQRKLVHKQFNSPMGLYSQENVKATLNRELKAFGADGIEIDEQISKPLNLANSAVLRAVEEEEQQIKCGDFYARPQLRPSRSRRRDGSPPQQQQSPPHHALHHQLLDQIKTQYLSHQNDVVIDRDTVLRINRFSTRRQLLKRDHSWPPTADQQEGEAGATTGGGRQSPVLAAPSHSIELLREKFNSPTRIVEPTREQLRSSPALRNSPARKSSPCRVDTPLQEQQPQLTPKARGFSAPETKAADADLGLVAPRCEYYEQLTHKRPSTPLKAATPYRPRLKRQSYSLDRGRARKRAVALGGGTELPPLKPRNGAANGAGAASAPGTPRVQRRHIKLSTELKICYDGDSEEEPKVSCVDIDLEAIPLPATPGQRLPRSVSVATGIDSLALKQQQQMALALARTGSSSSGQQEEQREREQAAGTRIIPVQVLPLESSQAAGEAVAVQPAPQPEQLNERVQRIYEDACSYLQRQDRGVEMTPPSKHEDAPATYVSATGGIKLQRQESRQKTSPSSCIPTPPPLPPPPQPALLLRHAAKPREDQDSRQQRQTRRQGGIFEAQPSAQARQHEAHLEIAQLEAKYAHIQQSITEHLRQIDAYMENAKTALQRSVQATPTSTPTPPAEPAKARATATSPAAPNELWDMFASRQSPILAVESPLQAILRQIYCRAAGIQLQPKQQQQEEAEATALLPPVPAENVPIVERALEDLHKIAIALDSEGQQQLHVEHGTTPQAGRAQHVVIEEAGEEEEQEAEQDYSLDYRHVSDVIANYEQLSTGKEQCSKAAEAAKPRKEGDSKEQQQEEEQAQARKEQRERKQQKEQIFRQKLLEELVKQREKEEQEKLKEQEQEKLQQEKERQKQQQEEKEKEAQKQLQEAQARQKLQEQKEREQREQERMKREQERKQLQEQKEQEERKLREQQKQKQEQKELHHKEEPAPLATSSSSVAACPHESASTADMQGSWCSVCGECRESPHGWGKLNKADQWRFDNLQNEPLANYKSTYEIRSPYISRQISWEDTQQMQQQSQPPQQQQSQTPHDALQRQRSEVEIVHTPAPPSPPCLATIPPPAAFVDRQLSRSPSPQPLRRYPAPLIDTAQRCSSPFGLNAVQSRGSGSTTPTPAASATLEAKYSHVPQLEGHNIGLLVRTATEPLQLSMSASSSLLAAATPPAAATPRCTSQPPPFDFLLQHGLDPHSEFQSNEEHNTRDFSVNRSFDNVSPRPYVGIEGYKRVAWPPASEERIVREFTPQPPSQSPAPGSGGYYPQANQAAQQQPSPLAAAAPAPAQGPIYNNVQPRAPQQQQQAPQQHYQPPQQPQEQPAHNGYTTTTNPSYPQQPIQYTQAQFSRQRSREPLPAGDAYPQQQQQQQYQPQPQQQQQPQYQQQYQPQQQPLQDVGVGGAGWKHIGAPQPKQHSDFTAAGVAPYQQQQQQQPYQYAQQQQQQQQQPQYRATSYDNYQQQQQQQPLQQQQPAPHWQQQQQQQPLQQQPQQPYGQAQAPYQTSPYQQQQQQQQPQQFVGSNYAQPQYNSYSQPQQQQLQPQQQQQQQQLPYSQDQTDLQQVQQQQQPQGYRGASPGIITLRKEAPVSQQPAPVYTSQPAAVSYQGGSKLRGDLKWPPPEYKEAAVRENEERRLLALGPVCRPRRVNRDYTSFFAKNQLNCTYPSYKVPPGTQHMFA